MELFILIAVVIGIIVFILFLRKVHTTETSSSHAIAKIYVDNHLVEFEDTVLLLDTKKHDGVIVGHFEELIEVLNRCAPYKEIYESEKICAALTNILKLPQVTHYIRPEKFSSTEQTSYRNEFQYGGCYFETPDGIAMVHAIGNTGAVLGMCSQVHDREEILRVSQKWEKQGYTVVSVATADVYGDKKNVLARGVKEKMIFLGLLAIKNLV